MTNHKRHKRLLKLLDEQGQASVEELMAGLSASAATVRRDIAWLAARQQLARVRGGAQRLAATAARSGLRSQAFELAIARMTAEKRAIARHAAGMCLPDETVIINGGSTTFLMADYLPRSQLRILTNSFLLAERLLAGSENQIILPGGSVYREQNVIVSPFENDVARHHYATRMFMGVHGISPAGLMEADPLLVQAERRLMQQAETLVVLVDSSKFERRSGLLLCGLDRVACVVTDTGAPDAAVQWLEREGVRVVAVAPEPTAADPGAADPGPDAGSAAHHSSGQPSAPQRSAALRSRGWPPAAAS
jgi:DeoR family ulaG and ulaABCDEF operon transcriptional repressor